MAAVHDDGTTEESVKVLSREFERFVCSAGLLMLNGIGKDLDIALAKDSNRALLESFVTGQETTLVLEKTVLSSDIDDGKEDGSSSTVAAVTQHTSGVYAFYNELPTQSGSGGGNGGDAVSTKGAASSSSLSSSLSSSSSSIQEYLLFIKMNERGLVDTMPICSQVIVSQVNLEMPFQAMIPFIRHSFVPTCQAAVTREETSLLNSKNGTKTHTGRNLKRVTELGGIGGKKDDKSKEQLKSRGVLEKLRELELKLAESQDETKFQDVVLEATGGVTEWLETLDENERNMIIRDGKYDNDKIPDILKEQSSLNEIQKRMRRWREEILTVVRKKSAITGTVSQQIKFWESKSHAISQIEKELKSINVIASTMILFQNNYTVQARTFTNQSQLNDCKKEIESYNKVLSTFPLNSLKRANSISEVIGPIGEIFQHLDVNKNSQPLDRIGNLGRAAARDVVEHLREIISRDVMIIKYSEFEHRTHNSDRLFRDFQNKYTKLRSDLRQRTLLNNRSYSSSWHREQETDLNSFQKRLNEIKSIRKGHSIIRNVIESTFATNNNNKGGMLENEIRKVDEAYDVFRKLDVLRAGDYDWANAVSTYESRIQDVENEIQQMVRKAMENAKDPREMFRVCEKFNKLFVRDRIRAAVWDFSSELLDNIEREVKELQSRYRQKYENIPASTLTQLRDIPQVSGQVIWCRQLKRQLDQHVRRLEAVLGPQWNLRMNGKDLAERIQSFATRLDPLQLVRNWEEEAKSYPNFDDKIPIFRIDKGVGKSLSLNVNFDENYVKLFKEVRCLIQLGIRIDIGLRLACIDVKQKYPIAVKLKDAVTMYQRSCRELEHQGARNVCVV